MASEENSPDKIQVKSWQKLRELGDLHGKDSGFLCFLMK